MSGTDRRLAYLTSSIPTILTSPGTSIFKSVSVLRRCAAVKSLAHTNASGRRRVITFFTSATGWITGLSILSDWLYLYVTRDGGRICAARLRSHDVDDEVLIGENVVPRLADALAATLH